MSGLLPSIEVTLFRIIFLIYREKSVSHWSWASVHYPENHFTLGSQVWWRGVCRSGRIFPGAGATVRSQGMLTPAAPIATHCAHQHRHPPAEDSLPRMVWLQTTGKKQKKHKLSPSIHELLLMNDKWDSCWDQKCGNSLGSSPWCSPAQRGELITVKGKYSQCSKKSTEIFQVN